jgi:HK97 family phage portal protein
VRSPLNTVARLVNRTPIPYVAPNSIASLSVLLGSPTGAEAQMQAMGQNGTLFSIVNRTSNATAQVDWKLYRKARSGKDEDRTEVTAHAALDLLNHPNRFYTRQELVEVTQQHVDLTGEGWWVIGRDPRSTLPLTLWPIRPDRMTPVPSAVDYLAGYVYTGPDGEKVPLGIEDAIFMRMPNPLDPYRGMGPVQTALTDLDAEKYSAEWNRNFFRNSAEPGGIVQVDKNLTDDEFQEHRARWAEQHKGVANAHRVAVLEGGMQWIDRKYTQRDMQFKDLRELSTTKIREAFGIPKFAVGDVEDVNRATAEASKAWFAEQITVPRLERIKGALNNDLLPLFGQLSAESLEFDYENPVPPDAEAENAERASKTTAAKTLVDAGYDPAGVLEVVGLPEIEHVGLPAPPALAPGMPEPGTTEPAPPGRRAPADARLRNQTSGHHDWELRRDNLIDQWATDVTPGQINELCAQIEKAVTAGQPADLANLSVSTDIGAALMADAMFAQADAAGKRVARIAANAGVSISPVTPIDPGTTRATVGNVSFRKTVVLATLAADLAAGAKVAAVFLGSAFAVAAGRAALRVWSPGAKPADVSVSVRTFLGDMSDAGLRSEIGHSVWAAENEGRFATLEQAETDGVGADRYVATELFDNNTCGPCEEIDETEFDSLADAMDAYPFGGYVDCEGMANCRGSVDPTW